MAARLGSIGTVRVVLYSRPGCHLCDAARAVLEVERERTPFELREIDVQGDDALERAYGVRIPVVEIDGEERFEYEVDPIELSRVLREAKGTTD
jgi:glutaredoxin